MIAENKFVALSALMCEPSRAKMLWHLLDGRAYTAIELSIAANVSATSASNHLSKLLEANLIKADAQGRHRYFSFSRPEVAYAFESLVNLAEENSNKTEKKSELKGIKYCRTCYDHLAGFAAVKIVEALETQKVILKSGSEFIITKKGKKWLELFFGISDDMFTNHRRPIARQCLDWTERKPHLAGQLGTLLLQRMMEKDWFKKNKNSRELAITPKGRAEIYKLLKIKV